MNHKHDALLKNLLRYSQAYAGDWASVKRLLRVRGSIFEILVDQATDQDLLRRQGDQLTISQAGVELVQQMNSPLICPTCRGLGTLATNYIDVATRYWALRPQPNELIDQCPVTPEDLVRRVVYMYEHGDIDNRRILCVGDNDLASLLIAAVGKPKEICVIDIDDRIIGLIDNISSQQGYPIKTIHYDIRKLKDGTYPAELEEQFDVFQTDPPYTETGLKFFIALGLLGLRKRGACYIIIPHMNLEEWTDELLYTVERYLLLQGLFITDVIPGFQTFVHEHQVVSSLVRAERLGMIENPLSELRNLNLDKFYTIRG